MARRRPSLVSLTATLAALAIWVGWHPAVLQHPDSDLYDHLSVARHLVAGDGFLNDIAYPLSFAFPFAASVPQPLIHRTCGYPLLLTAATAASRGNPEKAVTYARWTILATFGVIIFVGLDHLRHRRRFGAAALWLPLLLTSPLVDMTVRWAQAEVVTALLLMVLWVRIQGGSRRPTLRHGAVTGLLCGLTALMRLELCWLPWLWLAVGRGPSSRRWWSAAVVACLLTVSPWLIRNAAVTGNPVFALQNYAEHLKNTPDHPGMSAYLNTEPESFAASLRRDPSLILRKAGDGVVYQVSRADNWIPWLLAIGAVAALPFLRRSHGIGHRIRSLGLLAASWGALVLLYSPLSHDLRYMMVLLPIVLLELALTVHAGLTLIPRLGTRAWAVALVAALGCLAILLVSRPRMPGWDRSRADAAALWLDAGAALARVEAMPEGPIITDHAAVFWLTGRAGMIRPAAEEVSSRLRATVPGLRNAYVVDGAARSGAEFN